MTSTPNLPARGHPLPALVLADLRYALRALLKSPTFTIVALLCLGLGIGANATMFSFTNAVFLRPLPVREPSRLARIHSSQEHGRFRWGTSAYPDFLELRALRSVFADATAYGRADVGIGTGDRASIETVQLVSGSFFGTLGVRPALGRGFLAEEDSVLGARPVTVLSYDYWQTHYGGDPTVVGQTLLMNGHPFTIVGVAPEGFRGLEIENLPRAWVPLAMVEQIVPAQGKSLLKRGASWLRIVARLAPGVDRTAAQAAVDVLGRRLAAAYPQTNTERVFTLTPGGTFDVQGGDVTAVFVLSSAVVAVVLLIACANVANLLLARGAARSREIAVRLSLGASRGRLVRQLLTESMVLALLGGVVGLLLALWGAELLRVLPLPPALDFSIDGHVLAYALAVSLATGVIFGLAPALQLTRPEVVSALKDGTAGAGRRKSRLRGSLVASQMALSLVLLVVAGLLLRTLGHLKTASSGYDDEHVLVASIDLETRGYTEPRGRAFYDDLLRRVRALPGVRAATAAAIIPMTGREYASPVTAPESPLAATEPAVVSFNIVTPGYFAALGIPLRQGRAVGDQDAETSIPVAVVNETMARRFWPAGSAIGKRLRIGGGGRDLQVVGVVADVHYASMTEGARPLIYLPFSQNYQSDLAVHVRTVGDPAAMARALRREVQALDPDLALGTVRTLKEVRDESIFGPRLAASLLGVFGSLALTLAAVGLYGVIAYAVSQRTREMGVRMALGAQQRDVIRLVVGDGLRLAGAGAAVGLVLAAAGAQLLRGMLYGVRPLDPAAFAGTAALLTAVALLASWLPSRRAARVDPAIALRSE